ncbi:MAG: mechanosensitive ion channel [Aureliella sp.]
MSLSIPRRFASVRPLALGRFVVAVLLPAFVFTQALAQVPGGGQVVPSVQGDPQAGMPQSSGRSSQPQTIDAATGAAGADGSVPREPASAEGAATGDASEPDTLATVTSLVEQRQAQITAADSNLPAELRESLSSVYQDTKAQVTSATAAKADAAKYQQMIASAIANARQVQTRLDAIEQEPKATLDAIEDLREGKEQQQALSSQLSAATSELRQLESELAKRAQRKQEIPAENARVRQRQSELQEKPASTPELSDLAIEANRLYQTAALQAAELQLRSLELESQAYEAESELLPLRIELARRVESRFKGTLQLVNAQVETLRSDNIKQSKYETQTLLSKTNDLAGREQLKGLLEKIGRWEELENEHVMVQSGAQEAKETLDLWRDRLRDMKSRVKVTPGGSRNTQFNRWVGLMLRRQRGELPDASQQRSEIELVRSQLRDAEAMKFTVEDALLEVRYQTAEIAAQPDDSIQSTELPMVLRQRQTVLKAINTATDDLIDDLLKTATTRQETIELVSEYRAFIDTHILWIRSAEPIASTDVSDGWKAWNWLLSIPNLQATGALLYKDAKSSPWWYFAIVAALLILVFNRLSIARLLGRLSQQAGKRGCSSFQLTGRALVLTALIASPVALVLLFVYWRLSDAAVTHLKLGSGEREYVLAVATGLYRVAVTIYPAEFLRQLCQPQGLAIKHFAWAPETAATFCRSLPWLILCGMPLVFVVATISEQADSRRENSLGRWAFIALMLLLCTFFVKVISPTQGIVANHLKAHRDGWLDRTGWLWYPLICLIPIAVAITSAVGFHYTAHRIAIHVNSTLVMLMTLSVVYGLLARWLLLNRRKLMLALARARLEEAALRDGGPMPVADASDVDMVKLNEQTGRLVNSFIVASGLGLAFLIWSDVLPAVEILDGVVIWEAEGASPDQKTEITLANIVLVIPVLVLMIIVGRNVPGLLEIGLLQHLPLSPAARYAVTTLFRYSIISLGTVIACSIVGLKWDSIQWLVAALGVGLGFGLQEIFANFVSGVILLFEQPLRVGDIVSIDGTTGTVSKIRMRATTIVNWDRQELIVPNKELITGKLLNWTLSDSTNRILVNVGVAYGCDTQAACEIIRTICDEHPNILSEPAPMITFEGFGDNALNIVVRAYLASLDNRLTTIHEVHQLVYDALGEAGIEIAFPQRDLHIRSLPDRLSRWLDAK